MPKISATRAAYAPWKLSTDDRKLALAVGAQLKRLGINESLCNIGVSPASVIRTADTAFNRVFKSLVEATGVPAAAAPLVKAPQSVGFNLKLPAIPYCVQRIGADRDGPDMKLAFAQALMNARPTTSAGAHDQRKAQEQLLRELESINRLAQTKPEEVIKKEAD
ncbi:hypothetical protein HGRIS_000756 [Hohenbuehelia grisea]|uniref:Uncharacterized protein n=1 Tax=Hohenbuehelia grisea TaxID=104357 RepID=A0ABR3IPM2_9AGAR